MAFGLQYDDKKPTECYDSVQTILKEYGALFEILKKIYIPKNWGYFLEASQNLVNLSAGVYAICEV